MEKVQESMAKISLSEALPSEGLKPEDKLPLEPLYKMCMKYYKGTCLSENNTSSSPSE